MLRAVVDFDLSVELLKRSSFRFRGGAAKYWWRLVPVHEWNQAALHSEPWAQQAGVRVEIWCDGRVEARHAVPGGRQAWASF